MHPELGRRAGDPRAKSNWRGQNQRSGLCGEGLNDQNPCQRQFGYNGEVNSMVERIVFRDTSPLGYSVVLTRNRWREIVRFKHPAIKNYQQEAKQCVSHPDLIRASAKDPDVHLHYLSLETGKHICVVVARGDSDERFVVTAYLTSRIKQGNELWKK
jgi:hypothetical protein